MEYEYTGDVPGDRRVKDKIKTREIKEDLGDSCDSCLYHCWGIRSSKELGGVVQTRLEQEGNPIGTIR